MYGLSLRLSKLTRLELEQKFKLIESLYNIFDINRMTIIGDVEVYDKAIRIAAIHCVKAGTSIMIDCEKTLF